MKWPVIVVSVFAAVTMVACKQKYKPTAGDVKATFVMSDTMLHRITVDTAQCKTVVNVLALSGKVTTVKKAQANIVAEIKSTDLSNVKKGMPVEVTTSNAPEKYTGYIVSVTTSDDPNIHLARVSVHVRPDVPVLKPGMLTQVSLHYTEDSRMVAIPASAVIFDKHKKKSFVMVFHDRYNINTRQVWPYKSLDSTSYLSGGLDEGEKVVSTDQQLIYNALNK